MKRAQHESGLRALAHQPSQALAHLATGLDGERAADDILWAVAVVGEQVCHARGQRLGLAGAWGRQDLEDSGWRRDRCCLGGIETRQNSVSIWIHGVWIAVEVVMDVAMYSADGVAPRRGVM